ncbi:MAG TPA: tetratricopeptide repeat protein [Anaeromyxobacteraceae bacterium]|nr:tetratricopeptide repeat protein [Anaeromyxobacteraceae bacterium]
MTLHFRVAVIAVWGLACAAHKQAWYAPVPEVLVEVLPQRADLFVDGAPAGPAGHPVPLPDPAHVYVFRATLSGFLPLQVSLDGSSLSGARLGLVLRPEGYGQARRLDFDDAPGLAAAAALLERRGSHADALEYAERAAELSPELPQARRVLGDAAFALGKRRRAVAEYSAYLSLAPDAPDRALVEARVEKLRGDMTIPGLDR